MNMQTHRLLEQLRDKYGPGGFGKIAQKLLALSFGEIGFTHIVERGVEGVDIDIPGRGDDKFAVEVKTTDTTSFALRVSNVQALRMRAHDGYKPLIAALRLAPLEKWILARIPLSELSPGVVQVYRLRAYRMAGTERVLAPAFDRIVAEHFRGTLISGQQYLSEQLEQTGIEVRSF